MERLYKEIERLKNHFDGIDKEREAAYGLARELRRDSVQAVRDIHRGRFDEARALLETGREKAAALNSNSQRFGFVEEAFQEYAEAAFTLAFLTKAGLPTQDELKCDERGYMLGLADAIGELRRHVLNLLRDDSLVEAQEYLEMMDDLFAILMKFDHTDAVIPLRRKQDGMRGVVERTRGDLTNIICQKRLERTIKNAADEK
jgi:translin